MDLKSCDPSHPMISCRTYTKRNVAIVIFPSCQIFDITSSIAVLEGANRILPEHLGYNISVVAAEERIQRTDGCLKLGVDTRYSDVELANTHMLVVPGGWPGTHDAMRDRVLLQLIESANDQGITIASICSGAFILGAAGVLDGHGCTVHWSDFEKFRCMFPNTNLIGNVIYHQEGGIWTSAGGSTGIDMMLRLVERDYGLGLSKQIARNFLLFSIRPPLQEQISRPIRDLSSNSQKLHDLVLHIFNNPEWNYTVPEMAKLCNMSSRNFTRRFNEEFDISPAAMVRKIRISMALHLINVGNYSIKKVAKLSGFSSVSVMRQHLNNISATLVLSTFYVPAGSSSTKKTVGRSCIDGEPHQT